MKKYTPAPPEVVDEILKQLQVDEDRQNANMQFCTCHTHENRATHGGKVNTLCPQHNKLALLLPCTPKPAGRVPQKRIQFF